MARGDMSNFVMKLQNQNKADIKKRISEELAAQMASEQKKESGWRSISNLIKSGVKMIDPTGGVLSAGVDTLIDPIGRNVFGAGADPSNIKAREGSTIFGGREGFQTAREGLQKSIDTYKDKSLSDTLAGMVQSNVLGKLKGDFSDTLARQYGYGGDAYAQKIIEASGTGDADYEAYLDDFFAANGGLVPKYFNGGGVDHNSMEQYMNQYTQNKEEENALIASLKQFDNAEADKWVTMLKATSNNPSMRPMYNHALEQATSYVQSRQGTTEDISQYVPEVTEGQDTYAKTEETAQLMKLAQGGDDNALNKLAQIARATRPELANKNWEDLKKEIQKGTTDINMYGGAYQDVNTQAAQQIQGMREGASAAAGLAYNPSGHGASQRGARLGQQTLSSGLSDIYAERAAGREDAVTQAFDPFDNMLLNISS